MESPNRPSGWSTATLRLTVLRPVEPVMNLGGQSQQESPVAEPAGLKTWYAAWDTGPGELRVGEERTLTLRFSEGAGKPLPVPVNATGLTVYLDLPPGLGLLGERRQVAPVSGGAILAPELRFVVKVFLPGAYKLTGRIYPGRELDAELPPVDFDLGFTVPDPSGAEVFDALVDPRLLPWPAPDLLIYVALNPARPPREESLTLFVTCPSRGLMRKPFPVSLGSRDAAAIRQAAAQLATRNGRAGDDHRRLRRFGRRVFDLLAPQATAEEPASLRQELYALARTSAVSAQPLSCLILSDEQVALPWELVLPYEIVDQDGVPEPDEADFLAAAFSLAQWFGRLGIPVPNEIPLRRFELAHYSQLDDKPELWNAELERWRHLLGGDEHVALRNTTEGFLVTDDEERDVVGIHLLLYVDRDRGGRIGSAEDGGGDRLDAATERRRLSFAARKPLITLSLVQDSPALPPGGPDLNIEQGWVLRFLRADASAVLGPRWPVPAEMDRLFYAELYGALYRGQRLGDAVRSARLAVRGAHPAAAGWLAYALFGHPAAEPYMVMEGTTFSVFEGLDEAYDGVLTRGEAYTFRASYGSLAPDDQPGRVTIEPEMPQLDEPRVIVAAAHLAAPVEATLESETRSSLSATVDIPMPDTGDQTSLMIYFMDGKRILDRQIFNVALEGGNGP
jgi:hypothetical protein